MPRPSKLAHWGPRSPGLWPCGGPRLSGVQGGKGSFCTVFHAGAWPAARPVIHAEAIQPWAAGAAWFECRLLHLLCLPTALGGWVLEGGSVAPGPQVDDSDAAEHGAQAGP